MNKHLLKRIRDLLERLLREVNQAIETADDPHTEWMTTYEAAKFLGIDQSVVRRACGQHAIPGAKTHHTADTKQIWWIPRAGLIQWREKLGADE